MSPKAVAEWWGLQVLAGVDPGELRVELTATRLVVDVRHLRLVCSEGGVKLKLTRELVRAATLGNRDSGYERTRPRLFDVPHTLREG